MISRRHKYSATVTALVLLFLTSCDRKAQDTGDTKALREEVQSLREELARQKAASPSPATPAQMLNTPAARLSSSPEFVEFVRASRRIVSAMGTGVTYTDFEQRLVDINASAEEVLPQIADTILKAKITNFVLSLRNR